MTQTKRIAIGKIPQDWKVVKLSTITEYIKGKKPEEMIEVFKEGYLPYLSTDYLRSNRKTKFAKISKNTILADEGDLILLWDGSNAGEIFVSKRGILSSTMVKILLKKENTNQKFLFYLLKIKERYLSLQTRGTGIPHVDKNVLENLKIHLPPLSEQKAIARILSTADEAIQKSDEIIVKTEKLKRGLMQELFTKGVIFGFMFDINIFNAILDNKISLNKIPSKFNYYVTHIQGDEIKAINKPENLSRKKELFEIFKNLKKEEKPTETFFLGTSSLGKAKLSEKPTESAVWDISKWDKAKWGEGDLYNNLLLRLQELDRKSSKKKSERNQIRDVLIAETCIKNLLILITNDENLRNVTREFNGQAIIFEHFLKGEYKEFKNSKIGKIPENWEVVKLRKAAEIIMGQSPPSSAYNEDGEGIPFLQGKAEFGYTYPTPKKYTTQFFKIAEKNDILISVRAPVGDVNLCPFKLCIGRGLGSIRIKNNDYLFYFYYLKKIKKLIENIGKGSTFKAINKDELTHIKLPLPPLQEQKAIAEILSTIDKKLELERKRKENFKRIKKGLMNDLLTGNKRIKIRG